MDDDFIKIREYLYEHDNAGIEEVSQATGVDRKVIFFLLKEERLIVGDENGCVNNLLTCEACKKPISTGRMCASCKKTVINELNRSIYTAPPLKPIKEEVEITNFKGVAKLQLKK